MALTRTAQPASPAMSRVIGIGIGTFLVSFFAIIFFLSALVSRYSKRFWFVPAVCIFFLRPCLRSNPAPHPAPAARAATPPHRPAALGLSSLIIVIIVLCVSPQASTSAATVAAPSLDGLAPFLPAHLSYQTIILAVVGPIFSFSAALALCGTCAEEALELRRAKRIP